MPKSFLLMWCTTKNIWGTTNIKDYGPINGNQFRRDGGKFVFKYFKIG